MSVYDADYYLRGKQTGKSLYEDYRWLPELTIPMVGAIIDYLDIAEESVLDFGCARGYIVKAMREEFWVDAYGCDTSEWAIANADPSIKEYLTTDVVSNFDWIIAKDVLEHIPQVPDVISELQSRANIGIFAVVPLSFVDRQPYVVPDYEKDVTHIHRLTLASWVHWFTKPGWEVTCCYRVPGIKDNYASWAEGNGFITCRRLDS